MYKKYYINNNKDIYKSGVYLIYFINNPNKFYVGSSYREKSSKRTRRGVQSRWREHLCYLKNNKHHSIHLQRAFNKYGIKNIRFEMIHEIKIGENLRTLRKIEEDFITEYNSVEKGYNISNTTYSPTMSMEERKKQSERMKLNNPMKNPDNVKKSIKNRELKPVLQYNINKELINEFKGTKEASYHVKRDQSSISEACRGKRNTSGGYIWFWKEEFNIDLLNSRIEDIINPKKREWSNHARKKRRTDLGKKLVLEKIECGTKVIFDSIIEAHESLGLDRGGLSNTCNGKRKTIKGYKAYFI